MNRREALSTIGRGGALGALAATAVVAVQCQPTEAPAAALNPALIAAIEAHRDTIRHDEALYGADCTPIVDQAGLDASDENIGRTFLAAMAVPCITRADVVAKVAHIMAGSVGLRENGWDDEFLHLLTGGENGETHDPENPLVALLRSLAGAVA